MNDTNGTNGVERAKLILMRSDTSERTKDEARKVLRAAGEVEPRVEDGMWNYVPLAELFKPLPPFPWLFNGAMRMGRGRPTMLAGYADSGKTILAQMMMLSVITGEPVLGDRPCEVGSGLHMNGEMNLNGIARRYQRLARGAGYTDFEPIVREDRLKFANYPDVSLDMKGVEDHLCRASEGRSFVLMDSLRAFSGRLDEKNVEIGRALLMLGRVSEKTGAVFMVIHHTVKETRGQKQGSGSDRRNLMEKLSGSGSIFGGCDSVFLLDEGQASMELHHLRTPEGDRNEPMGIGFRDIERNGDKKWGLRVAAFAPTVEEDEEAVASKRNVRTLEKNLEDANSQAERILRLLQKGPFEGGRNLMLGLVGGNAKRFNAALDASIAAGNVIKEGTYKTPIWRLRSDF